MLAEYTNELVNRDTKRLLSDAGERQGAGQHFGLLRPSLKERVHGTPPYPWQPCGLPDFGHSETSCSQHEFAQQSPSARETGVGEFTRVT